MPRPRCPGSRGPASEVDGIVARVVPGLVVDHQEPVSAALNGIQPAAQREPFPLDHDLSLQGNLRDGLLANDRSHVVEEEIPQVRLDLRPRSRFDPVSAGPYLLSNSRAAVALNASGSRSLSSIFRPTVGRKCSERIS